MIFKKALKKFRAFFYGEMPDKFIGNSNPKMAQMKTAMPSQRQGVAQRQGTALSLQKYPALSLPVPTLNKKRPNNLDFAIREKKPLQLVDYNPARTNIKQFCQGKKHFYNSKKQKYASE